MFNIQCADAIGRYADKLQNSFVSIQFSIFNVQCSMLNVQNSMFNIFKRKAYKEILLKDTMIFSCIIFHFLLPLRLLRCARNDGIKGCMAIRPYKSVDKFLY
jgi:hypothetical protein